MIVTTATAQSADDGNAVTNAVATHQTISHRSAFKKTPRSPLFWPLVAGSFDLATMCSARSQYKTALLHKNAPEDIAIALNRNGASSVATMVAMNNAI